MSSKIRKPNQSRQPNRPTSRGNRQTGSQSFVRPPNREFANLSGAVISDTTHSEFFDFNIKASIIPLVGCHVQVCTVDDIIYDGVLNTISPAFVICLANAHIHYAGGQKKQDQRNTPNIDELIPEISFDLRDIICIKCKNVDLDFARKDLFQTDSMISGTNGSSNTERELKPWQPDYDDGSVMGALEDMADMKNGVNYDELKRANEKRFNFTSTYTKDTMSKYMDDIETDNKEVLQQRERQAERIVEELEKESSYKRHDILDSGLSEEDKYSSVKRPGSNSSPNRNSNASTRGRGRSRTQGFDPSREPLPEPIANTDMKINKNLVGPNKRQTVVDDAPKPLYSQLVQRSAPQPQQQLQHENSNVRNQRGDVIHHTSMPYQPPGLQQPQQRQRMQNEAQRVPNEGHRISNDTQRKPIDVTVHTQSPKITPNQNSIVPPRMQQQQLHQQQQQKMVTPGTSYSEHASPKPRFESQPAATQGVVTQAAVPMADQRSASFDNDKEIKRNRESLINSAKGGSLDRSNLEMSTDLSAASDVAKGSPEMSKHPVFMDAKGVPKQKYGRVQQQHQEEKAPDIERLKHFNKAFKLGEDKSSKKASKAADSNQSQSKDSRKQETESLVIKLSPDPPLKEASPEWRLPQVQKMNITDDTEAVNEEAKPDVEEKENITKQIEKAKPEKVVVEEKNPESDTVQASISTPKLSLNPNAKEFKLNPNANSFVPLTPPPVSTAAQASPAPTQTQNIQTSQLYQPPRMVVASSPPVIQGNVQAIPVIQAQGQTRFKSYSVEPIMESPSMSSVAIPGMVQQQQQHQPQQQQQQHIQQQQQQQQQQQNPIYYVQYQAPVAMAAMPPQHSMTRHQWQQPQGHVGHAQLIAPVMPESQGVVIVPSPTHMMTPQQQPQPMHASQTPYAVHPPTQSAQPQQIPHYMVNSFHSQQYPQMGSPLTSNTGQGTQVIQGIQRPPTSSQHPSATPPMHHGQQLFYGTTQMPAVNMQPQSTFVSATRNPVQMQTFQ